MRAYIPIKRKACPNVVSCLTLGTLDLIIFIHPCFSENLLTSSSNDISRLAAHSGSSNSFGCFWDSPAVREAAHAVLLAVLPADCLGDAVKCNVILCSIPCSISFPQASQKYLTIESSTQALVLY